MSLGLVVANPSYASTPKNGPKSMPWVFCETFMSQLTRMVSRAPSGTIGSTTP